MRVCVYIEYPYWVKNCTCTNIFIFDRVWIYSDLSFHVLCVPPRSSFRTEALIFSDARRVGRLWSSAETLSGKHPLSQKAGLPRSHLFSFHTRPLMRIHIHRRSRKAQPRDSRAGPFCRVAPAPELPAGSAETFQVTTQGLNHIWTLLPFRCSPSWLPPIPT